MVACGCCRRRRARAPRLASAREPHSLLTAVATDPVPAQVALRAAAVVAAVAVVVAAAAVVVVVVMRVRVLGVAQHTRLETARPAPTSSCLVAGWNHGAAATSPTAVAAGRARRRTAARVVARVEQLGAGSRLHRRRRTRMWVGLGMGVGVPPSLLLMQALALALALLLVRHQRRNKQVEEHATAKRRCRRHNHPGSDHGGPLHEPILHPPHRQLQRQPKRPLLVAAVGELVPHAALRLRHHSAARALIRAGGGPTAHSLWGAVLWCVNEEWLIPCAPTKYDTDDHDVKDSPVSLVCVHVCVANAFYAAVNRATVSHSHPPRAQYE